MIVEVYTKNKCPNCLSTKSLLNELGIEYEIFDLFEDKFDRVPSEHFERISSLGLMAAPAVLIWDDDHKERLAQWAGHLESRIRAIPSIDESEVW